MNRRVFTLAAVASVALHAWLIWPSRPPAPRDSEPEAPPARVAVREVDAERIERMRRTPAPAEAEVPPPPAEAPRSTPAVAEAPPPSPPSRPVAVAVAPTPTAAPATETPRAAPPPTAAPIHAAPPSTVAVVDSGDGTGAPASESALRRIESFEAQADRLSAQAPSVPPLAVPPAPAQAPPAISAQSFAADATPARAAREIPPVQFVPRTPRPAPKSPAFPWLKRDNPRGEVALASAAAPSHPQAGAAVAAAPASVPMRVVPREPTPYRPVNFGGGRAGTGRSVSQAFGQAVDRGSMESLASTPPQDPVARIAWGSAPEAMRLLDVGRMALVTVDDQLRVVGALEISGGSWRRTASVPDLSSYSNRVRVVDHVAGFGAPASLCSANEHLAVVVPIGLERRIDRAMDEAARRQGLSRAQVAACYGRLVSQPTGLEFEIDRVERRNGT